MLALVSLIATVKMSDTGQYTFGRLVRPAQTGAQCQPGQNVGRCGGRRACRNWHGVARVYAGARKMIVGPTAPQPSPVAIVVVRNCRGRRRHIGRLGGVDAQARRGGEGFEHVAARLRRRPGFAGFAAGGRAGRLPVLGVPDRGAVDVAQSAANTAALAAGGIARIIGIPLQSLAGQGVAARLARLLVRNSRNWV